MRGLPVLASSVWLLFGSCNAFSAVVSHQPNTLQTVSRSNGRLFYSNDESTNEEWDKTYATELEARLTVMRTKILEDGYQQPPNAKLSAHEFVAELLRGLWQYSEPWPESGFRLLLRASTDEWRQKVYESVGAPFDASEEAVASALGGAMGRPNNQFGILVGEDQRYMATFPGDVVDYGDGTCWVECQLRDKADNALLADIGWQLRQRETDGAWLVDGIDWQDFRDEFRPGIGREEWMRIMR